MTAKELNDNVQFIVDKGNHAIAVVVPSDLWHNILHALEESSEREFEALLQEQVHVPVDVATLLMANSDEDLA